MWTKFSTLALYIRDISRFPLLSRKEEYELASLSCKGDKNAVERLVESNLRLVVKIAHEFTGLGVPYNELIAEGNIGLMKSATKYSPYKGAKFSTYSALWIKQAMRLALANLARTVRVPLCSLTKLCRIHNATIILKNTLNRNPTSHELADYLELPLKTVENLRNVKLNNSSLHSTINAENGQMDFMDMVKDPSWKSPLHDMEHDEKLHVMRKYWDVLQDREKQVLTLRYGLDGGGIRTLQELSDAMNLTRERIRQIQHKAVESVKKHIDSDKEFNM